MLPPTLLLSPPFAVVDTAVILSSAPDALALAALPFFFLSCRFPPASLKAFAIG
jgi:hypothetical protein